MSKPWQVLDRRETPDGVYELRQRDAGDFLICIDGRVLMNSRASRSEEELGVRTCRDLGPGARVLVGGLGMGLTLRAVLDTLPADARVTVSELQPLVEEWCAGPLAVLSGGASCDPRVTVRIGDVADAIREAAARARGGEADRVDAAARPYHAIVLDLFEGPHAGTHPTRDPIYGKQAIERTWWALEPGGLLGVWGEAPERQFEARLRSQGFEVQSHRPGRGGLRHWIVLARRPLAGRSSVRKAPKGSRPR